MQNTIARYGEEVYATVLGGEEDLVSGGVGREEVDCGS